MLIFSYSFATYIVISQGHFEATFSSETMVLCVSAADTNMKTASDEIYVMLDQLLCAAHFDNWTLKVNLNVSKVRGSESGHVLLILYC